MIDLYIGFEVDSKDMQSDTHQLEYHEIRLVYIILREREIMSRTII